MFDVLLSLVEKKQVQLIELYLKERKEKGEGLFAIIHDGNKADIRYYLPDNLPYSDIAEEYKKTCNSINKGNKNSIEVKDKWIITLPILEIETDKDTIIPIWNLILDDGKNHVFFQGFPQEVEIKNGLEITNGLQYVLVGEPHEATIAKNNWTVEATTSGQRYLQKCLESSQLIHRFLTFRSDSDFCRIISPGKKEDGDKILERISISKYKIIDYLDSFRINDKIGSPMVYKYENYGNFSPNTLRYVNTLYELLEKFGEMKNWNILEFGGGYGGLCHILSYLIKWKKYTFVEIKEPLELAKKCFLNIPVNNINCISADSFNSIDKLEQIDLFISEFGFCELNENGIDQNMFMLKNSKNAYLSMNLWDTNKKKILKNKLLNELGFKSIDEYPVFIKSEWGDYIWICKK
jgi:putative sugar O-methyltransferase